ncbi:MAG: hypothetical protein R2748_09295 [Bryobacterales bacterium]
MTAEVSRSAAVASIHRFDRERGDARRRTAPARMDRSDGAALGVNEQQREAVGDANADGFAGCGAREAVAFRARLVTGDCAVGGR